MSARRGPIVAATALLLLAGVAVWGAYSIPVGPGFSTVGPSAFPIALSGALLVLAVLTLVQAVRGRIPDEKDNPEEPPLRGARARMGWMFAGIVLTPLTLHLFGFLIGGTIGFGTVARAFGARSWTSILAWGAGTTLLVWLMFDRLLTLNLGDGLVHLPPL